MISSGGEHFVVAEHVVVFGVGDEVLRISTRLNISPSSQKSDHCDVSARPVGFLQLYDTLDRLAYVVL